MSDDTKQRYYAMARHDDGEYAYNDVETIRLAAACDMVRQDAERLGCAERYELLDVGCGIGPLRQWLPAERFCISGLELSPEAIAIARRRYDDCRMLDVEGGWPVKDRSVDAVHAGAVLEHLMDWHTPLNEANRVLRDDGLLVLSVPNLRYWKEIRKLICNKQPHWLRQMGHLHGFSPSFLRQLIELHGFTVIDVQADRINLPLMPRRSRLGCRLLAGWGAVLIVTARLSRRALVVDRAMAHVYPEHAPRSLRAIEVPLSFQGRGQGQA